MNYVWQAGRLQSNAKQKGNILVNGRRQTLSFGTSVSEFPYLVYQMNLIYIHSLEFRSITGICNSRWHTHDDAQSLTVREAIHYSAQLQLPNTMTITQKKERAETTIKEMGLKDAADTRIGGWMSKGISGEQKRRVSICMEILTRPKLLFLDEPTSGLDSAASFHVMSRIAGLAQREGITVLTAIHQPSSEVFALFHNLCLLSGGKTVYFGPAYMTNEVSYYSFLYMCYVFWSFDFFFI